MFPAEMPTVGERLATLEEIARQNRSRIEDVYDLINGGGDTPYEHSVRGRLHKLESVAVNTVLRRNLGVGLLKGWERFALVACALATACAAWYSVLNG